MGSDEEDYSILGARLRLPILGNASMAGRALKLAPLLYNPYLHSSEYGPTLRIPVDKGKAKGPY